MTRWIAISILVLALQACASGVRPAPAETMVRLVTPFGPGRVLQRGVVVSERLEGRCFAASAATGARPDAWRCMAGNRILDPCFEGTREGSTVLACVRSPWDGAVALLALSEPLPSTPRQDQAVPDGRPWALELADGSRCTFLTGATSAVAGLRVNYGCEGGTTWVVGDVDRRLPAWTVFVVTADGMVAEQRTVRNAWY
jgi:hypothetical protein